jgi:hypothetical protein
MSQPKAHGLLRICASDCLCRALTATQRAELKKMAASSSLPHRQVVQAKALLWAAEGVANQEIARRCQVKPDAVRRWRTRFDEQGVDGVGKIAKGCGRKSPLTEGTSPRSSG